MEKTMSIAQLKNIQNQQMKPRSTTPDAGYALADVKGMDKFLRKQFSAMRIKQEDAVAQHNLGKTTD